MGGITGDGAGVSERWTGRRPVERPTVAERIAQVIDSDDLDLPPREPIGAVDTHLAAARRSLTAALNFGMPRQRAVTIREALRLITDEEAGS